MQVLEAPQTPLAPMTARLSDAAFQVDVVSDEAGFDALREEWDDLIDNSDQGNYFLRWDWNRLWWRLYAPAGSRLFLITCRDENGRLMGLAPFFWRQRATLGVPHVRELVCLGTGIDMKSSEYLDVVFRRGCEAAGAAAMVSALNRRSDWDRIWIWGALASSAGLQNFQRALGSDAQTKECDLARWVDTTQGWDAFKQTIGKATRKNIEIYLRRMTRDFAFSFERVKTMEEMEAALDALIVLHQARWQAQGEPGSFTLPHFEDFFREIVRTSMQQGRLRMWTLRFDDRIVSAQVAFFDNGIAHVFQGGFDPTLGYYRIGNIIFYLCIQECIESGDVREFDFMGGATSYKQKWTRNSRPMVELEYLRPGIRSMVYATRVRSEEALRSLYRTLTPDRLRMIRRDWLRRQALKRAGVTLPTQTSANEESENN